MTLSTSTEGALIRYTTDGTTPSATVGVELANGGAVTVDRTTTLKAVAYRQGWTDATVTSVYTLKVSPLTLTPAAGTFYAGQTVTLATPTEGALIRYTTDGTTPSATVGTVLASGGTVSVDRTMTVRAIAYKPGWGDTLVVTSLYTLKVSPPTLTPPAGAYSVAQTVTLATPTEGAQIRYTTDGTTPTTTVGTLLAGGTVVVDRATTIRAIAYKPGWTDATVTSAYTFKVSPLTFTPATGIYYADQAVTLATPTEGALVRYTTDGTTPSATVGTPLANGGTVSVDRTTTLKAIAYRPGWGDTLVASAVYTLKVSPLTLTPAAGSFYAGQTVTLSTSTEGVQIRYTTDGTAPSATVGTALASGGTVSVDRTTTLRAIAYRPGWTDATVTGTYSLKVSALTLTPLAGTYYAGQTVTLATPTEGAQIRYTTDGTTPSSTMGTLLASGDAVSVDRTMTIKAIAFRAAGATRW